MNLIANNCLGAFIYEKNKMQFSNPFIWSLTKADSLIYVMKHYKDINWENIELDKFINAGGEKCYSIIVDDNVRINYTHYIQGSKSDKERIVGRNVYDYRAYEYTFNKYTSRVKRMMCNNEKPVFLILECTKDLYDYNFDKLKEICECDTQYKRIIITQYDKLKKYKNDKIKIIIDKNPKNDSGFYTEQFADLYKENIMEFINE